MSCKLGARLFSRSVGWCGVVIDVDDVLVDSVKDFFEMCATLIFSLLPPTCSLYLPSSLVSYHHFKTRMIEGLGQP